MLAEVKNVIPEKTLPVSPSLAPLQRLWHMPTLPTYKHSSLTKLKEKEQKAKETSKTLEARDGLAGWTGFFYAS